MILDEIIKQNSTDGGLDKEAIEEVAELIGSKLIPEVIRIADKYNYDRDSMVKYCADLYSAMAEVATFENWKGGKEWPNKWIPVSERLPEDSGNYLIAIADSNYTNGQYFKISWFYPSDKRWSYRNAAVIAWMPLPEPYKAEGSGKE